VSRCKGCGGEFRRGLQRKILLPSGDVVGAIVCRACAGRALSILTPTAPPPPAPTVLDGRELLERVRRDLRTYVEAAKAFPMMVSEELPASDRIAQLSHHRGRIEGLETGIARIDAILRERRNP
jgi:hypothetical protein